ncbi:MAG: dTDP-4-dehydrorhamnose 3,5-epimerase family protein [Dongiaceae bacterium]
MSNEVPPGIKGHNLLAPKSSAVDSSGALRVELIEGLKVRITRPVPHEDGHVIEIARKGWEILDAPVVQVHMTTTLPGRHRAWGLHRHSADRLFVARGLVKIAVYDGRTDSPTYGRVSEFTFSDRNPGLVVVPPNLYHGWKNIGTDEAIVINMPTSTYTYDEPDAWDLPWDSKAAEELIPYRF